LTQISRGTRRSTPRFHSPSITPRNDAVRRTCTGGRP
jgi:hypothetical protein